MKNSTITIGKFSYDYDTRDLAGPEGYMTEQSGILLAKVRDGMSAVFNYAVSVAGSNEVVALLTALQTDYAGWRGMQQIKAMGR